ncbi:UDP-4-amino-4,6-dideoxy-N-acetyl-beta-L-altrosamine N-acetyltransferase [Rhodovulum adriaticum]|uniref:UDP-4-amino-4, 6-dideoxy-N-acetyl-beta-L-altrosamine N-acetyltransferase n=1 Tax=Rhodovulum adriaticum TaxID=35804 RepID=UPI00104462EB|nr:UDP-4-amino-4,6-dideoxy-N-acetyl-beta-L-altrosamine N-acetyltransferase [Rhodovulum adriaticum]MBK1636518.1 UDP-4-amino-4,6-dideoxy-N-acetyl-beta-L-altrosamine N-acetyltransferase [Rhodovulum adriaticum]
MTNFGNLRVLEDTDLELIRSWRNAPEVASKMYTRHYISESEHKLWWQNVRERDDQSYFLYEKANIPLGVVSLSQIDTINKNCFWAFYASPCAPPGTGSKMEFLALEHVFGFLGMNKLSCEVLAFNEPVIKLHKKFGFREEGRFREHHRIDDKHVDIIRLGMLAREWSGAREEMKDRIHGN